MFSMYAGNSGGLFTFTFYSLNGDKYQFPIQPVPVGGITKSYDLILPSKFKKETKVVAASGDGWFLTKVSVYGEEWYNGDGIWVDGLPLFDAGYNGYDYNNAWLVKLEGSPRAPNIANVYIYIYICYIILYYIIFIYIYIYIYTK
jgi:hypothetical protein